MTNLPPPEMSRPVRIETLGSLPRDMKVEASEAEREALAQRFDLERIDALEAEIALVRTGETVKATGTLRAAVTQRCVASNVPVEAKVEAPFDIAFGPPPAAEGEEEVELDASDCDTVFYRGDEIDVGEAVAETLLLSLDPWPRAPDADAVLKQAGIKDPEEVGPFAALAALRDTLKK